MTTPDWYRETAAVALELLESNAHNGLSGVDAQHRLEQTGPNELVEKKGRSKLQIFIAQFTNILTVLLVVAALVSAFLDEWVEAVAILIIVVLNGLLGYIQESRAEQAMAALKRMSVPVVKVRRDGHIKEISAREIVPGDVVILETGNIVPADGRILSAVNLRVEEAALTGESEAVEKESELIFETERPLGDRRNMVYSGTIVNYGRGEFITTATGMQTELGTIAKLIQSVEEEETPLQQRLEGLGKWLAYAALGLIVVVMGLGWLRGERNIENLLLTGVSLAVAAIPEALTAVVTIALSLGAQRMLKRNALIRRLPAVETLGSVNVICSDKTGTLTINRMTVTAVDVANNSYAFEQPEGGAGVMRLREVERVESATGTQSALDLLLIGGALNSDATLEIDEHDPKHFSSVGDPTEGALVLAAALSDLMKPDLETAYPRIAEVPFDSVRKRMTTIHRIPQSDQGMSPALKAVWERRIDPDESPRPYVAFTKGAIDGMLSISTQVFTNGRLEPLTQEWHERVMAAHDKMAAKGMRVLGLALRTWDKLPEKVTEKTVEEELVLIGMFGMIDPPRPEVTQAVANCRTAGIRPVMITGDHPLTARHIAQQIGITSNDKFMTGQELDKLSPEELKRVAREVSVFARVSPEHKLQLIDAFQQQNNIVAMTGDGVNDAPALKKADIGVAMGITGTDVAKGSAEMVLLDDNFATIVAAVEEGRIIFDNIRRFIKYLLTCNASEIAVMLIGPLLGMPLPLLPLQILWMNLVTDGLPALALGVEPAEKNVMRRPPLSASESIFGRGMIPFILIIGIVLSLIAIGSGYGLWATEDGAWQTALFTTLVFSQMAMAIAVRSEDQSIFKIGFFSNRFMTIAVISTVVLQLLVVYVPFLQRIFKTQALSARDLALCFGFGVLVLVIVEIWKAVLRRREKFVEA